MVKRLFSPTVRYWGKLSVDALAWVIGILSALVFRYEFDLSRINLAGAIIFCAVAAISQIIAGSIVARVWGVHSFGSFFEARSLIISTVFVAAVLAVLNVLFGVALGVPRSIGFIAFPITVLVMGITRYVKRLVIDRTLIPHQAQRVLIYGAGHLGANLTGRMLKDPASTYLPVGFIDDDTSKSKFRIQGLKVYGTVDDLASAVAQTQATAVIVSMRKVDTTLLRKVSTHADAVGLRVLVLPPLEDMLSDPEAQVAGIRDLAVEDFIGRNPIQTDLSKVSSYVTGKRVLVTGAGGSIGSELCKQLATFGPAELVMLDRDESQLQGTQLAISGHGLLDSNEVVLSDIRDVEALNGIFQDRRPEVVFHAAALKHLPLLEQYPDEAWKTNVLGTLNVLNAAVAVGVETFVNISTDKAANPVSVLGHSKRVAERLTGFIAEETGLRYLSVRFGNVIGSRGSMLPAFTAQIAAGGPVTVTDPNVTRFFMTIPEACQLVIQAGAIGAPGEVLILDMGEPVKILDIAQRLIAMSGKKIDIVFTGLRPGEKMHEELIGVDEISDRKIHPLISHTVIKPMHPDKLDQAQWNQRRQHGTFDAPTPQD